MVYQSRYHYAFLLPWKITKKSILIVIHTIWLAKTLVTLEAVSRPSSQVNSAPSVTTVSFFLLPHVCECVVCMCVCGVTSVWMYMCVHVCGGPKLTLGVFFTFYFIHLPCWFWLVFPATLPQGTLHPHLPSARIIVMLGQLLCRF